MPMLPLMVKALALAAIDDLDQDDSADVAEAVTVSNFLLNSEGSNAQYQVCIYCGAKSTDPDPVTAVDLIH